MGPQGEVAADADACRQEHQHRTDSDEPPSAEALLAPTVHHTLGDIVSRGFWLGVLVLLCYDCRNRILRRIGFLSGGVQLAGASISFHPSSPGLLELTV